MSRVVTDTRGEDECTAYDDLKDWLLDYSDIDERATEAVYECRDVTKGPIEGALR